MRQSIKPGFAASVFFLLFYLISPSANAQYNEWSKDTISRTDALAGRLNYLNNIRGGGNPNATEQINLPVDKLKAVLDACATNGITDISVIVVKIRQADVAHYRQYNPNATDADLKGSQMVVFRVPRKAFGSSASKAAIPTTNPLMMSLASAGLVEIQLKNQKPAPYATDVYMAFGMICPPPASCGD